MHICEQCGSGSRHRDGFCGGCGALWPLEIASSTAKHSDSKSVSPYTDLPAKISSFGIPEVRPKVVSVAVLLSLLLGPIGLAYSTMTGAIVMAIGSVILPFLLGNASLFIILPACAIWAWRAARESQSVLD